MNSKERPAKLAGAERAAILLMSLGEDDAAAVLKHMGPKEVQRIGTTMASLQNVSRHDVGDVLDGFVTAVEEQTALGVGAEDYIRKMLAQALGEEKSSEE